MATLRMALSWLWRMADARAKRLGLVSLALLIAGSLLAAAAPIALKLAIDSMGQGTGAQLSPLVLILIYVLGLYATRLVSEWRALAQGLAEQRLQRQISVRTFEHLLSLPMSFHARSKTGAVADAVDQGLRGFEIVLQPLIGAVLPALLDFAIVSVVLVQFAHPEYLIVITCALAAYLWAVSRPSLAVTGPASEVIASHMGSSAALTEALVNIEAVKAFGANRTVVQRYESVAATLERAWSRFFRRRAGSSLVMSSIGAVALAGSLAMAAYQTEGGTLTLGSFVLVHAYILRLLQPLELVSFAIRDIGQGIAGLQSLLDLLSEPSEDHSRPGSRPLIATPALEFGGVSFSYATGSPTLRNVSFRVHAGKTVAIVGASGSGKSTLIRLILRLYEPDAGQIRLDGVPIQEIDLACLRHSVALVPQDTTLFHDTLAYNIAFGSQAATAADIEEAARASGLHGLIDSLPDRYHTLAGERGLRFSAGEKQRVAIARAIVRRARVLLIDEATSSLDSRTEAHVLHSLASLCAGRTTLIVAHRLATIAHADSIVVLHEGRVVESGTHQELLRQRGHYAELWAAQHPLSSTGS
jgi:ABC-type transport system involved in Fe-S cluster assembly fused permease/ATPase subunit